MLLFTMWDVNQAGHLEKTFSFPDFKSALAFTNVVGALAEQEKHHPDIHLSWGKVRIELWTHRTNSVSEKDHALARKIDSLC